VTFTVDLHHHILPDFFWRATNEGDRPVGGIAPPPWSRVGMLSFLDDAGIDVAVTSISIPGVHTGDDAAARALARRCNELAAEMVRDRPDRFGGFACLPLPDVDGALAELAHAFDVLRLDGVLLFSNARGTYLGDRRFTSLFDELQRRAAVVFVHPNPSPDPSAHALGLPDSLIDYTADTTRAIAELHYSNTFARTPDVKYVFSHAGGTVPYQAGRFGIVDEMRVIPGAEDRATAAETFRRLYWDTALSWGLPGAADAAGGCGNRPRRVRFRLPVPAPRPCRRLPAAYRDDSRTQRQRANGRPRCHGGEADPAAGRPSSAVSNARVMTQPRQTLISPCSACPIGGSSASTALGGLGRDLPGERATGTDVPPKHGERGSLRPPALATATAPALRCMLRPPRRRGACPGTCT
jgi:predicted TIM-barrel fold metal-dependent hydrolase